MIKKVFFVLVTIFYLLGYSVKAKRTDPEKQQMWVDSVFQSLSLEEKVGQLFMVAAYSNKDTKHSKQLRGLIKKYAIGGLIFFQGGPVRQVHMINQLQSESKVPMLIGMDLEWGLGMRLDSTISFPRQMTLGAIEDDQLIYEMGLEIARQCKLIGVHINFAPVIDVNVNPGNPVIGTRSFGENKENVAKKGLAYMKGLQDGGILACAKHFPGHGDTFKDSHKVLPVITHSEERIKHVELYPFRKLIDAGVGSIMVAHLNIPSLDETPDLPTTLSPKVVTGLLREKLNFQGLIFTDALNMGGITGYAKPGEMDLKALKAGNDILLFPNDVADGIKAIVKEMKNDTDFQKEVMEHVKRILNTKYELGLFRFEKLDSHGLIDKLNANEAKIVNAKLNRAAVTIARDDQNQLPIKILDTARFASLSIGDAAPTVFHGSLDNYAPFEHYFFSEKAIKKLKNDLQAYDYVVVGVSKMNNLRSQNYSLDRGALDFLRELNKKTNLIISVFGNPYALDNFSDFGTIICGYHHDDAMQQAIPEVIFGALPATGSLPVSSGEVFKFGDGVKTQSIGRLSTGLPEEVAIDGKILSEIDDIAKEAIADMATPGCQILIARNGKIIFDKSYGYYTYDSSRLVTKETLYDIASVTKVAATLQAAMLLEAGGVLDIDLRPSDYLEELRGTNKEDISFKAMLTHQAGLKPFISHWEEFLEKDTTDLKFFSTKPGPDYIEILPDLFVSKYARDSVWQATIASDLRELKEDTCCYDYKYSDIGFYILHEVVERVANQPLEDFVSQNLYEPLGLNRLTFNPLEKFPVDEIAPTEEDLLLRGRLLQGYVHDPGAALYGGVAGHAGLFSNAHSLATLLQMNIQDGYYGGTRFLPEGTVEKFTEAPFENNRRAVGWDKPKPDGNGPTSDYASFSTYGHTGFTGTAAWVDPEFDLIYIFLSNRIHPNAQNDKLIENNIRTRVQDVIYKAIFSYESVNPIN